MRFAALEHSFTSMDRLRDSCFRYSPRLRVRPVGSLRVPLQSFDRRSIIHDNGRLYRGGSQKTCLPPSVSPVLLKIQQDAFLLS